VAAEFEFKDVYNIDDLIKLVAVLRAPGGCPWDIKQTHESIKKNFIEETYEVIEAINKNDADGLREELGDILLQVALHSQMESEKGTFDFNDVANDICRKLIVRDPHVFGRHKLLYDRGNRYFRNVGFAATQCGHCAYVFGSRVYRSFCVSDWQCDQGQKAVSEHPPQQDYKRRDRRAFGRNSWRGRRVAVDLFRRYLQRQYFRVRHANGRLDKHYNKLPRARSVRIGVRPSGRSCREG